MARRRTTVVDDPHDDIVAYYRERLARPAVLPWKDLPWEPVRIGPTWETEGGHWKLPEQTLGWDGLAFCGTWLKHDNGDPWRFTDEQARWWLWWYAVDSDGRFVYRDGVLQRLKGWGKDPVGACLLFTEAFGPCRFDRWDNDRPTSRDVPNAWVQTAAVALEQTKNTMRLFPVLVTDDAKRHFGVQIGKELVHGLDDTRLIQAVTSSPTTLEGARSTFVLKNETQHWDSSNDGHEMADVIERNQTKSPDGGARSLAITNAYEPSNESVAQNDREAWEKVHAGGAVNVGLLYDSLEAPAEAPLSPDREPDEPDDDYESRRASIITDVVSSIRGDSTWLDVPTILKSILDIRNPPSRSRRFWFNQITATEDAWVSPQEWDASADPAFEVQPKAIITLGFDGSLSDDDTALIGCHVDGDHLFSLGIWSPPKNGEVDRRAIDRAVRAAFELYDVVGFYADLHPWESYIDAWTDEFVGAPPKSGLVVKSSLKQPIAWDMRDRGGKLQKFTEACERLQAAIIEPGGLTHDGSRRFRIHALNARRAPNKWGVSVRKEHRESARKIDAVPAAVLARLARMDYVALPPSRRRKARSGKVW